MKAVLFTEENLKKAATEIVIYVTCPHCQDEVAMEADAREACRTNCREVSRIINLFF